MFCVSFDLVIFIIPGMMYYCLRLLCRFGLEFGFVLGFGICGCSGFGVC